MEKRHLVGTDFDHALWTRRATYGMSFLLQEARYRLCGWSLCAEVSEAEFMWHQGLHDAFCGKNGMPGAPAAPTCTTSEPAQSKVSNYRTWVRRLRRPTYRHIEPIMH
jgi:hypothetical protein